MFSESNGNQALKKSGLGLFVIIRSSRYSTWLANTILATRQASTWVWAIHPAMVLDPLTGSLVGRSDHVKFVAIFTTFCNPLRLILKHRAMSEMD
jgi:hypothetical protein